MSRAVVVVFVFYSAFGLALRAPSLVPRALWRRVAEVGVCGLAVLGPPSESALAAKPQNAASSAGSRVNKDADSLLRYGLPLKKSVEKDVRKLQVSIENTKDDLKAKRLAAAEQDVEQAQKFIASKGDELSAGAGSLQAEVSTRLAALATELGSIGEALRDVGPAGSPQERASLDAATERQSRAADLLSQIEARLVEPPSLTTIPKEYANSPRLQGRARVRFVLKKNPGAESPKFDVDGDLYDRAVVDMIVDGYTAPLTAGNFLDLVQKKFYDGMPVQRADGFVIQTGDPDGPEGPLVGFGQKSASDTPRTIPLELNFKGDKNPTYSGTSEDLGRGAAATTLPFQAFGALGMARDEYEPDSASSQFFFLLFDSDLTPAGKNLLDGRYANFGYTVKGEEFLKAIAEGDLIEKATLLRAPPPFGDYTGLDP